MTMLTVAFRNFENVHTNGNGCDYCSL